MLNPSLGRRGIIDPVQRVSGVEISQVFDFLGSYVVMIMTSLPVIAPPVTVFDAEMKVGNVLADEGRDDCQGGTGKRRERLIGSRGC